MAATEAIHLPLSMQLDRGTTLAADSFRNSAASRHGSPPYLLDLLQGRPYGTAPSSAAGGLCI
jgi:hypothetical protein